MNKNEFVALLKAGDNEAYTQLISTAGDICHVAFIWRLFNGKRYCSRGFFKNLLYRTKLNPNYSIEGFLYRST